MDRSLTLAYSPCPNDTYIFAALANGLLERAPAVKVHLEDVENLNNAALKGSFELTKVSYGAIPMLMDHYRILRSGGALGHGCGPLVVTRKDAVRTLDDLREALVAIPGERTTAFMLLRLAMGMRPATMTLRFDKIVDAVAQGVVDAGLIIHESRFTYESAGLRCVADLGEWWESQTGMPIPLGAILVRDDVGEEETRAANEAIRASLRFAREQPQKVMGYVREHATEMEETVMHKHIETYVNEFSDDLGAQGIAAVEELFRRAQEASMFPGGMAARFV